MKRLASLLALAVFGMNAAAHNEEDYRQILTRTFQLIHSYEENLHPHQNPFARVFSVEAGQSLFEALKYERVGNQVKERPLSRVLNAFEEFRNFEPSFNLALVSDVISTVESELFSKSPRIVKQSHLLALQYLVDYMRRFASPDAFPDYVEPKPADDSKDSDADSKEEEEEDPKPEEYPELGDNYDPHTKDTEKNKKPGKKENQVVVLEANFETPYFGQKYYADILRHAKPAWRQTSLASTQSAPGKYSFTGKQLTVKTLGKTPTTLFLPPGYSPLQSSDPRVRIVREKSGAFKIQLTQAIDSIEIPLVQGVKEQLMPQVMAIYTRPVGIGIAEWPDIVQTNLFSRYSPDTFNTAQTREVAKAVADHIAVKYKYSVGERPERDPVEALKAGAFQCDMATFTMISILRDVYQIPSRAVAGFRAKKFGNGSDKKSYLVLPGEAHAWVEVYIDGEWVPFDPTPLVKDKKDKKKEEGEKDEYSDRSLDDTPKPEEDDNQDENQAEGDETQDANKSSKPSLEDRVKNDTDTRLNQTQTEPQHNTTTHNPDDIVIEHMDEAELARRLEIGSLDLKTQEDRNPLLDRAKRVLLRTVIYPGTSSLVISERLHLMASVFLSLNNELTSIFNDAQMAHERAHKPLSEWLNQIASRSDVAKIPDTYRDLFFATKSLEVYLRLIDDSTLYSAGTALLRRLRASLDALNALAHKDSPEISMVDEFYRELPPLLKEAVSQQYGLNSVGPNGPTQAVAQALRNGRLNDLRLVASLTKVSDFILNSVPTPEYQNVWTYMRSLKRFQGNDLLPLQRFSELARAMFLQPGKSIEENLAEGTAYVPTRRHIQKVPTGYGDEDSERITIVLFDISASMGGQPAQFQEALIRAFTSRAISDVSLSGRIRHKVVLIPFDDEPRDPIRVTTKEEALNVLSKINLARAEGGTAIHKALMQGLSLIADAQQTNNNNPLASANIVLMTDGQGQVDLNELARARNAIDSRTPVQIMFAAIGTSNPELMQLAQDSRERNVFDQGFYREFSNSVIEDSISEANGPLKAGKPGNIYSDKDASNLPITFKKNLLDASQDALHFLERTKEMEGFLAPLEHLRQLESTRWLGVETFERPLVEWIRSTRTFAFGSVFQKFLFVLHPVVHDLMINFKKITGNEFHELSNKEQEELRHLLKYAAGIEGVNGEERK